MNKIFPRKAGGFTIMELIIVVVIIGVLAAIALPSYHIQMLKMKNQEAVRILMYLWEAQKDYYRDNGTYADNLLPQLGIDLTDLPPPKNFMYPVVSNAIPGICQGSLGNILATIGRNAAPWYSLAVVADGRIFCCNWDGLCPKMGFPDW